MGSSPEDTNDELGDLKGGEGSLDDLGDTDVEGSDGVVGVLLESEVSILRNLTTRSGHVLTMREWTKELKKTNIQMGADM